MTKKKKKTPTIFLGTQNVNYSSRYYFFHIRKMYDKISLVYQLPEIHGYILPDISKTFVTTLTVTRMNPALSMSI